MSFGRQNLSESTKASPEWLGKKSFFPLNSFRKTVREVSELWWARTKEYHNPVNRNRLLLEHGNWTTKKKIFKSILNKLNNINAGSINMYNYKSMNSNMMRSENDEKPSAAAVKKTKNVKLSALYWPEQLK